jgi:hypothetical protein
LCVPIHSSSISPALGVTIMCDLRKAATIGGIAAIGCFHQPFAA